KTVGPAETALAMFSLLSMIGAFVYISYTTLRTLRSPLLRSLRVKVKMDPAGTEKEVDDAFAEEEEEEEMEKEHAMFDAGLDAMIEEAARQKIYAYGNIHTLSSLDAELPDIGEVLRKRCACFLFQSGMVSKSQLLKSCHIPMHQETETTRILPPLERQRNVIERCSRISKNFMSLMRRTWMVHSGDECDPDLKPSDLRV
ncbi:hypothetical protein BC830DRAFT_1155797, partial [Chytriomyces sp. MP71]